MRKLFPIRSHAHFLLYINCLPEVAKKMMMMMRKKQAYALKKFVSPQS